jgi:hypothetical protein
MAFDATRSDNCSLLYSRSLCWTTGGALKQRRVASKAIDEKKEETLRKQRSSCLRYHTRALVMASPFTAAAAAVAREKSGGVKDKKWPRV